MKENFYQNPLLEGADPYSLLHDNTYYLYSTNDRDNGFRVFSSPDCVSWVERGHCLRKGDVMGEFNFWAPEVIERNGVFYMVYVSEEHLGVATATSPLGPFRQSEKSWLFDFKAIDGHFFTDDDGVTYLYFVRFDHGNVIWCAKMNDDLLSCDVSTLTFLLRAEEDWELRQSHIAEGPFVLKHKGLYYLTYSANHTKSPNYAVGYAVSESPFGPFRRADENPILCRTASVAGTGHHSFTTTLDGKDLLCVYHAHSRTEGDPYPRMTCVDRAAFVEDPCGIDRLRIYGPTNPPQPIPQNEQ